MAAWYCILGYYNNNMAAYAWTHSRQLQGRHHETLHAWVVAWAI